MSLNSSIKVPELLKQDWMYEPSLLSVLKAIKAGGKEIRFIGGCVRDGLLHKPVCDVDLATTELPNRTVELLKKSNIKAIMTGFNYGTVTAVVENHQYQITTLRRDVRSFGRHATIEYTHDWKLDAARRDFTFNAMSATPNGVIFDYYNGYKHLKDKKIKFIGNAEDRIIEDHLRILRYFRFLAVLGVSDYNNDTPKLCMKHSILLRKLSPERIRQELFKILLSDNLNDTFGELIASGITKYFLPEAQTSMFLNRLIAMEKSFLELKSVRPDPIRRLASVLDAKGTKISEVSTRLNLSNKQKNQLNGLINRKCSLTWNMHIHEFRAATYKFGPSYMIDLLLLEWSKRKLPDLELPPNQSNSWLKFLRMLDIGIEIKFPIKGQDLIELGLDASPRISNILSQLEQWWLTGGCKASRTECLIELRRIIGS